jgi:hypothetical protein
MSNDRKGTQAGVTIADPAPKPRSRQHTYLSPAQAQNFLFLTDAGFKTPVGLLGSPGSGKSRLIGGIIAPQLLLRGKPLVIIDPTGGAIDALLGKIASWPPALRQHIWPRLLYDDAGATDFVVPKQIYYRASPTDSLYEIANRLPALIDRMDPDLRTASIEGFNALYECGIYAGQVAAALGRQLDFVADLLTQPEAYLPQVRHVAHQYPELRRAVGYLQKLANLKQTSQREKKTASFFTKLTPFLADPAMLATFSASKRTIDYLEAIPQRKIVLHDLRDERDPDRRKLKMLWIFRELIDAITVRGMAGRGQEFYLLIDEFAEMVSHRTTAGTSLLAQDLEHLTTRLARNYGVNVLLSCQSLAQLDEDLQSVMLQLGTLIVGRLSHPDDAVLLARQFRRYDPTLVRKYVPVWRSVSTGIRGISAPSVVDYTTVEYSVQEQHQLLADKLLSLPRFEFICRAATVEGGVSAQVQHLSIAKFDQGQYPDAAAMTTLRSWLRQASGVPITTLLQDMKQQKLAAHEQPKKRQEELKRKKDERKTVPTNGKITEPPAHAGRNHSVSAAASTPAPSPTTDHLSPAPAAADEVWTDEEDDWQ